MSDYQDQVDAENTQRLGDLRIEASDVGLDSYGYTDANRLQDDIWERQPVVRLSSEKRREMAARHEKDMVALFGAQRAANAAAEYKDETNAESITRINAEALKNSQESAQRMLGTFQNDMGIKQ